MQRWEYFVLLSSADFIGHDELDQLGRDGWELVSVTTSVKSEFAVDDVAFCNAYFKRPLD